ATPSLSHSGQSNKPDKILPRQRMSSNKRQAERSKASPSGSSCLDDAPPLFPLGYPASQAGQFCPCHAHSRAFLLWKHYQKQQGHDSHPLEHAYVAREASYRPPHQQSLLGQEGSEMEGGVKL